MPVAEWFSHRLTRPRRQGSHDMQGVFGSQVTRVPRGTATPAPTAVTIPENSCPSVTGGVQGNSPWKRCRSVPQIPAASTRICTSPGPGSGIGISLSLRSPGPKSLMAFMLAIPPRCHYRRGTAVASIPQMQRDASAANQACKPKPNQRQRRGDDNQKGCEIGAFAKRHDRLRQKAEHRQHRNQRQPQ